MISQLQCSPCMLNAYSKSDVILWMQVAERTESSQKLACVLQERKAQQDLLQCQLHEAQTEWSEVVADHMQLQTDVQSMRRSLEVCIALPSPCSKVFCEGSRSSLHNADDSK